MKHFTKSYWRLLLFGVLILLFPYTVRAFGPTGSIVGTVVDSGGFAVPNATVTVTEVATGFSRQAVSAADGGYVCALLPPGTYDVVVQAQGFKQFEQKRVMVNAEISTSVYAKLAVGVVTETVVASSEVPQVDTRSGTLRETIGERTIQDLPLDGRNAADLVLLAPGTSSLALGGTGQANSGNGAGTYGDLQQPVTYPGAEYISSNGAQGQGVNYLLDGGTNVDVYSNVNNPFPNPEALEEFAVQTNNYGAQYGRGVGAVVNIVTKSGTNKIHGNAFEFFRDGAMNAARFSFGNPSTADHLQRNQFGGSLGGPAVRDKLFFFGNYQGTILTNQTFGNPVRVFSTAEKSGDFTDVGLGQMGPEDPASANLLKYLPDSPTGYVQFTQPGIHQTENQSLGRVDYATGKNVIFARYFYTHYLQDPYVATVNLLQAAPGEDFSYQIVTAGDTLALTHSITNVVLFSYDRNVGKTATGAPFGVDTLGVKIATPNNPEIFVSVGSVFTVNTNHFRNIGRGAYQVSDTVHWIAGKHELMFGGDYIHQYLDEQNNFQNSGKFKFTGRCTGNALADLYLGCVHVFQQGGGEYQNRTGNLPTLFVNDNFRVLGNLSISLGVRWDPFFPFADALGRTECWRPGNQSTRFPNAPQGYLFSGDAGCPAGGTNASLGEISPRVGFSYDLRGNGRTVIRGGAGMFTQPPFMNAYNDFSDSAPFSPQYAFYGKFKFSDPYANTGITPPFPQAFSPYHPPASVSFADQLPAVGRSWAANWHPMQLWTWNLTLERQIVPTLLARAGYVGSKGTHEAFTTDMNELPWAQCQNSSQWVNDGTCYADANFVNITEDVSGGNSEYHSIQAELEQRLKHGLSFNANYTWNHITDWVSYQSDTDSISAINPFNPGAYKGTSDLDIRHRLTVRSIWQIPGRAQGFAHAAFADWQVSGLLNWQSGAPFSCFDGGNYSFTNVGNELCDLTGSPVRYTSGSILSRVGPHAKWFDTSAFTDNQLGEFGTAQRNMLRGPRSFGLDMSLQKELRLVDWLGVTFRAEAFNILNHPNFGVPDSTYGDGSSFGTITAVSSPRILQLATKLKF